MLRLDGRAIAFHYCFALEGCMYVHRLAFDPALARFSPGLVNTLDAIEAAADEGLTRVEFLGGGERYKVELADGFEPLYHGFGLASGVRGRAFARRAAGQHPARLRLKRSERAPPPVLRAARARRGAARSGAQRKRAATRWALKPAAGDEARDADRSAAPRRSRRTAGPGSVDRK